MKTNNIWVCDFETIVAETNYFKKYNRTGIVYGYLENMEDSNNNLEFINILDLLTFFTLRRNHNTVYFHNLSFDGVFIYDWLGKNGFTLTETLEKEGDFTIFRNTGGKLYKIVLAILPKGCKKIRHLTFLCSKMILSSSVKALGKNSQIEKFLEGESEDEGFYIREPENTLLEFYNKNKAYCEYCKRDVKIVIRALKDFYIALYDFLVTQDLKDKFKLIRRCITISAVSLTLQKLLIQKQGIRESEIYLHRIKDRLIMDQFTNGGLSITNLKYQDTKLSNIKGYCIDLKSAYPAAMSKELPYGDMLEHKPEGSYCCFQEIYYEKIWADNHTIPLLKNWKPKVREPRYFLEKEQYTTYLLKEEAETLEKLYKYNGKKIVKEYYFKTKNYLKDFIDNMYYYKEFYKKENELGKSLTFKILLNSGYGIHAKRMDYMVVTPFNAMDQIEIKNITYNICDHIDLNKPDRHSYIPNNSLSAYKPLIDPDLHSEVAHKGIANYITAKTRIKIMEGIIHFGVNNFVYCDTDSLFLINISKEEILKYCGANLGDWELEENKDYNEALFLRSKLYATYKDGKLVKAGSAGLDKNKLNYEKIHNEKILDIEDAILVPHRVDGGIILLSMNKTIDINAKISLKALGSVPKSWSKAVDALSKPWKEKE